ncbi:MULTISPECIES: NAD(+) synthase [unclassified Flavobacterium]|uniref:NAD(+) synthase n=1 Tax=unclassified Flavobacterium TaxID=196869 RepID=UPI001F14468A|nr:MULTISPECIES: NAD(+) synthase [unclassified Flavobacterium]UMY66798.1 NAD(+) synthase [Flavobacterium sp. HJ-32-4]
MQKNTTLDVARVNTHIVAWLQDYAVRSRTNGFVVGISGGIDSAVTSTLCAQTGLRTLCVEMPIHQPPSHWARSSEHIAQLQSRFPNVEKATSDLTPLFESFKATFPGDENEPMLAHTLANTRARLRMTTLYYHAGLHGLLVAGTGNKVEDFGVGFYTKYGDGGVDVSPIADLVKSEVYALGRYLSVPDSILVAPPTDGLFGDDRSDEDQLGATYDELEEAMAADAVGKTIDDFSGREKIAFEIYKKLNNANRHKMIPIPVCLIPEGYR